MKSAATSRPPAPAGNTMIMKLCATVKPFEVACTLIVHTPGAALDHPVLAASGAVNVASAQSEVHAYVTGSPTGATTEIANVAVAPTSVVVGNDSESRIG